MSEELAFEPAGESAELPLDEKREAIYRFFNVCLAEVQSVAVCRHPVKQSKCGVTSGFGKVITPPRWKATHSRIPRSKHSCGTVLTLTRTGIDDYLEVRGYADAAQWAYSQALEPDEWTGEDLISISEVRHLHHLAMSPVWNEYPPQGATEVERPGNFRRHEIRTMSSGMQPVEWTEVPNLVRDWVDEVNHIRDDESLPLIERVARSHDHFERIHPFLDGNGRVGRLLLNLLLVRLTLPPAIILKEQRADYLDALELCDRGDPSLLGQCLARAIIHTLRLVILPVIVGPGRFVLLSGLTDEEFTRDHLAYAARHEKFEAEKDEDGFWRSSINIVNAYKAEQRAKRTRKK